MNPRSGRGRSVLAIVTVLVGLLAFSASAGARTVVYSNIVSPMPGNYASIGFEATSTSEYGGEIELAGSARKNPTITVGMSSWGCQNGGVYSGETCQITKPGKKFHWPMTLNVYSVGAGNTIGTKLASVTKTFAMPYRPNSSKACTEAGDEGAWLDSAAPGAETIEKCFHGFAWAARFPHLTTTVPSQVIVTVSYNTTAHGEKPVGASACSASTYGCYYDSLNVAVVEPAEAALSVGTDPTETQYVNSGWSEMYCGSSESLNTLQAVNCPAWYEGDQPAIKVEAGGH